MKFHTTFFLIIVIGILGLPGIGFAESKLEKQTDQLTPEDASNVSRKLIAKQIHPVPEKMLLNFGFTYNNTILLTTLNQLHRAGLKNTYVIYGSTLDFMFKLSPNLNMGFSYGKGESRFIKQSSAVQFREDLVQYKFYHLRFDRKLYDEKSFVIRGIAAIGMTEGEYGFHSYTEDGSANSKFYSRHGSSLSYELGSEVMYYLNPVWNIGMGLSYLGANIVEFKNKADVVDSTAPEMDLGGAMVKIFTKFNL
jgi:hypothetical protein